ncbi:ATP synthase F0 subunit A [Candidatus Saccharibacteria bacterium]|nr:MAG: ATP synthase F0 subunit A [Candidatus Saccharibacteria bacterium]
MGLFSRFAAESGPSIHVAPAGVHEIGGLTITNSILYGWICMAIICAVLIYIARRVTVRPKGGLTQFVEAGAEFIIGLVESNFNDKSKARKYIPFFVTIFFFILLNNWLGLLPGVGDALAVGDNPLFRAFTADLNGTLAIGIVTMVFVYVASVRESGGFKKYLRHFFVGSPWNPLYFIIGLLEMLTDLTRVLSLSLRLFLNITIGEIVIAVFSYLGHVIAPVTALPFTLVELFVGALQAYIFTVLSLMYLAISVNHASEHDEHVTEPESDLTPLPFPEKMKTEGAGHP